MYIQMRYEWDARKNLLNQRRHAGISFEVAALAFEDPYCLVALDHVDETGEQRWHVLGFVPFHPGSGAVLLVVNVYRENHNGEEVIRIISARRAGPDEVRRYQAQDMDEI